MSEIFERKTCDQIKVLMKEKEKSEDRIRGEFLLRLEKRLVFARTAYVMYNNGWLITYNSTRKTNYSPHVNEIWTNKTLVVSIVLITLFVIEIKPRLVSERMYRKRTIKFYGRIYFPFYVQSTCQVYVSQ